MWSSFLGFARRLWEGIQEFFTDLMIRLTIGLDGYVRHASDEAEEALQRGDARRLYSAVKRVPRYHPGDERARRWRKLAKFAATRPYEELLAVGTFAQKCGDGETAFLCLSEAQSYVPQDPDLAAEVEKARLLLREYVERRRQLSTAQAGDSVGRTLDAEKLLVAGEYEQAAKLFEESLGASPDSFCVLVGKATCEACTTGCRDDFGVVARFMIEVKEDVRTAKLLVAAGRKRWPDDEALAELAVTLEPLRELEPLQG